VRLGVRRLLRYSFFKLGQPLSLRAHLVAKDQSKREVRLREIGPQADRSSQRLPRAIRVPPQPQRITQVIVALGVARFQAHRRLEFRHCAAVLFLFHEVLAGAQMPVEQRSGRRLRQRRLAERKRHASERC